MWNGASDKCAREEIGRCSSDNGASDRCGTVQATNVQKTSSDDAPVTTVQATNVEARTIHTEHTTRSFRKRKVADLKPSPPWTPPPVPDHKPKPPSTPPPAALLSARKMKKKGKRKTECADPNLVGR